MMAVALLGVTPQAIMIALQVAGMSYARVGRTATTAQLTANAALEAVVIMHA
jgi:hypothetical protein